MQTISKCGSFSASYFCIGILFGVPNKGVNNLDL